MQYEFKNVLVVFDAGDGDHGVHSMCNFALDLVAQSPNANVAGASLVLNLEKEEMPIAKEITERAGVQINNKSIEGAQAAFYETARKQRNIFSQVVDEALRHLDWLNIEDDWTGLTQKVTEFAKAFDVIVIPRPESKPEKAWWKIIENLASNSGRPVIVVPVDNSCELTVRGRVLLAWDGSQHAARAVHDALPVLCSSNEVMIGCVTKESDTEPKVLELLENLADHLDRHGVTTTSHIIDLQEGQVVSDALSRFSESSGLSLVVMGAFGSSWLAEKILGSTARNTISKTRTPILLSH